MITKMFETDRPVFFISDKEKFNPAVIDMNKSVYAISKNTLALSCAIITDDIENTINICIDEEFYSHETMEFVTTVKIMLPSGTMEIIDSDFEHIFRKDFEVDEILLDIYVNKDHEFMPEVFDIVIKTK